MSLILKRIAKALYGSFGHSSEDEQADALYNARVGWWEYKK